MGQPLGQVDVTIQHFPPGSCLIGYVIQAASQCLGQAMWRSKIIPTALRHRHDGKPLFLAGRNVAGEVNLREVAVGLQQIPSKATPVG
jgi:hypothetical protein